MSPGHRAPRILLSSHDGYGLGHVRRNARIAAAVLRLQPRAEVTVVTGTESRHPWLDQTPVRVERVPSLVKDAEGRYRHGDADPQAVLAERSKRVERLVEECRPDVVLVDRHPFGIAGELRAALARARQCGAAVVLGLRDVLDDPSVVRRELAGPDWEGATEVLDDLLVYGHRHICDHVAEYALPLDPTYCGIVLDPPSAVPTGRRDALVVSSGGGGDGAAVATLAASLAPVRDVRRTVVVLGPAWQGESTLPERPDLEVRPSVPDCSVLYAEAAASLQMAGYNSTYEALRAGLRPVLVPRRHPRREQAIRATRLQHLGLADVLDFGATPDEAHWLLEQPRRLPDGALEAAGVHTDGAEVAAGHLLDLLVAGRVVA
jgi:predicted glycosyltransferase